MITAHHRCTEVVRARVVVIAIGLRNTDAVSTAADVPNCARVTVVASLGIVRVCASNQRQTGIVGAGVGVAAADLITGTAYSALARIVLGAEAVVAAWGRIWFVQAPLTGVAEIIGAHVAVVTIQEVRCLTSAVGACFTNGTGVTVIATPRGWCVHTAYRRVTAILRARIAIIT